MKPCIAPATTPSCTGVPAVCHRCGQEQRVVQQRILGADDDPGGRQPGQVREQGRHLRVTALLLSHPWREQLIAAPECFGVAQRLSGADAAGLVSSTSRRGRRAGGPPGTRRRCSAGREGAAASRRSRWAPADSPPISSRSCRTRPRRVSPAIGQPLRNRRARRGKGVPARGGSPRSPTASRACSASRQSRSSCPSPGPERPAASVDVQVHAVDVVRYKDPYLHSALTARSWPCGSLIGGTSPPSRLRRRSASVAALGAYPRLGRLAAAASTLLVECRVWGGSPHL